MTKQIQGIPSSNSNPMAAVAVIICHSPHASVLVLRRVTHPEDPWSGHFSLPGGKREHKDRDLFATCVRETFEETGINLNEKDCIKPLTPQAAGNKLDNPLWVQPFLFSLSRRPELALEAKEIADYVWLRIKRFKELHRHQNVEMFPGELFPTYPLQDYYLWGFTYRLLSKLFQSSQDEATQLAS